MASTGIPGTVFGFLHLFYCILCTLKPLRVVPREFLWPQTVIFNDMSCKLVYCIKTSLYATRSLHLMVKFMSLAIGNDLCHFQLD